MRCYSNSREASTRVQTKAKEAKSTIVNSSYAWQNSSHAK